jgi:hypothetical protein
MLRWQLASVLSRRESLGFPMLYYTLASSHEGLGVVASIPSDNG